MPRRPVSAAPTRPREQRGAGAAAVLILVAALAAAYSNSFQGPFIFDDLLAIQENASIRRLWPLSDVLWPRPQDGRTVDGRPLVNLSLALNYAVSGLDVWSYHAFNLAIHVLATLTLFGLVRRTLLLPKWRERFGPHSTGLALAVALIWGLHPLQTGSVTYIVQRAESMMGLFYLLVLYCVARGETGAQPLPWRTAAVAACLAGMATKEVMVTAPVVTFLYLAVFVFDSWSRTLRQRWRLLAALASTWILLAPLVLLQGRGTTAGFSSELTPLEYAKMQLAVIVYYLKLCFSPYPLVLDYGMRVLADTTLVVACGTIIALLLAGTLWSLVRQPWIGFLGSAFFLILSPSSSIVPVLTQTLAEHRMYLPLASVVCLTVMLCHLGLQRWRPHANAGSRPGRALPYPALILTAVALLLGTQTWLRNLDYRTAFSIWKDTVDKQPLNARAHANLAREYLEQGDSATALRHADRAVELSPHYSGLYYARGTMYLQLHEYEKAMADLDKAIEIKPDLARAYQNRGVAHRRLGRLEQAVTDFTRALELNPELLVCYRNRALALAQLGRHSQSRADIQQFLAMGGALDDELRSLLNP
jgi:tetratricopeptide (TPR) repeat protein